MQVLIFYIKKALVYFVKYFIFFFFIFLFSFLIEQNITEKRTAIDTTATLINVSIDNTDEGPNIATFKTHDGLIIKQNLSSYETERIKKYKSRDFRIVGIKRTRTVLPEKIELGAMVLIPESQNEEQIIIKGSPGLEVHFPNE